MKRIALRSLLVLAISVPGSLVGDRAPDTYPKNPDIDIEHYAFQIVLSDATDLIRGIASIDARFLAPGYSSLRLDLVGASGSVDGRGMAVDAIVMDGRELEYRHEEDQLFIDLDREVEDDERVRITIGYRGIPATGLQIGPNKHGDRTFFSDNWPNRARNWLPTVDHPYDKATSEMRS